MVVVASGVASATEEEEGGAALVVTVAEGVVTEVALAVEGSNRQEATRVTTGEEEDHLGKPLTSPSIQQPCFLFSYLFPLPSIALSILENLFAPSYSWSGTGCAYLVRRRQGTDVSTWRVGPMPRTREGISVEYQAGRPHASFRLPFLFAPRSGLQGDLFVDGMV